MRVAPATETILNQVLKKREGGIPQIIERNLYKFLNVKKAKNHKNKKGVKENFLDPLDSDCFLYDSR